MKRNLKILVNSGLFSVVVQLLIAVSLISFCIETIPDLPQDSRCFLRAVEIATIVFFTLEYLLRLLAEQCPKDYALSFFGVIDLLAIAPFYLSTGLDLRSLRSLRFLRVFQLLKLSRYSRATRRFHIALMVAREELVLFGFLAIILLFLSSVGIYYFEHETQPETFASVFHCMWWSVATLTTVGYGDIYPVTAGGKLFTFFVLIIGLGVIAMPAGLIASALAKAREIEETEQKNKTENQ